MLYDQFMNLSVGDILVNSSTGEEVVISGFSEYGYTTNVGELRYFDDLRNYQWKGRKVEELNKT